MKLTYPGTLLAVNRCLNNTAPYPASRNLFNLTTLNTTSTYTGPIAPGNQTELCLSGKWHIPANSTDYASRGDREVTLQQCNASDPKHVWQYGVDEHVEDGEGKAYKLSLNNENECASILKDTTVGVPNLVFNLLPCVSNAGSQVLMVMNGTSTPTEKFPGVNVPSK